MDIRPNFHTVFVAFITLSVLVSMYLTNVFLTTLLLSVLLVYLLDPIYLYILHSTKNRQVSSFLTIIIASSMILYLVFFVATHLLDEMSALISPSDAVYLQESNLSQAVANIIGPFFPTSVVSLLDSILSNITSSSVTVLEGSISALVASLPVYITQLILLVFFTYYFFIDGRDSIVKSLELMPEREMIFHFLMELNLIYNIFFRVQFFVAVVSAVVATVGFFIIGIPYPVTWGIILGFFALLPALGPAVLFVPMSLYYLAIHDYARALEVFAFGELFLVFLSEYILRPRLVLMGASVHPVITILAFTAPVFVIGPSGVIVGPAIYGIALAGYRTLLHFRKLGPIPK
jgi:predicted PurR-regulated permease PerM